MEKSKILAGVFVALSLVLGGAYIVVDKEHTYYCESKDLVGYCDKLSGGKHTRCYFEETYKTCPEGWRLIEEFIEIPEPVKREIVYVYGNGENYECEVIEGKINSYTICISPTNREAYLGELI